MRHEAVSVMCDKCDKCDMSPVSRVSPCQYPPDNEARGWEHSVLLSWPRLILGFIVSKEERNVEIWSGVFKTISAQVFLWVPDDSSSLTMIFLTNDSMTSWLEFIII